MNLDSTTLKALCDDAVSAARAAGRVIASADRDSLRVETKATVTSLAGQLVTQVDREAQAVILRCLAASCSAFDLAVLAEESADDQGRLVRPAFWCIDPIDGTLPFVQGQPGYSVSIALVARDATPLIGVVLDPLSGDLYRAIRGLGVFKNDRPLQTPPLDRSRSLLLRTDFSFETHPWFERTQVELERVADAMGMAGASIDFRTGAVLNACELLQTPHICYFKYPRRSNNGGSLWDYAATACLFNEAGAVASDLFGQAMELNRAESTFMNHRGILYASNRELAGHIVELHRRLAG